MNNQNLSYNTFTCILHLFTCTELLLNFKCLTAVAQVISDILISDILDQRAVKRLLLCYKYPDLLTITTLISSVIKSVILKLK